jgi:hypothetical protein
VLLDGFAYGALNDTRSVDVRKRLHCIARVSDGYAPAFCDRLSAAYQCARQDEMAEPVLIARQHRRYATTGPAARIRGALQRWTVGHGYRPWLAVCWSIGVWALGTDWFAFHERCRSTPTRTPASNPRLFAADMPPPIVDLGQDGYRRLVGASQ